MPYIRFVMYLIKWFEGNVIYLHNMHTDSNKGAYVH